MILSFCCWGSTFRTWNHRFVPSLCCAGHWPMVSVSCMLDKHTADWTTAPPSQWLLCDWFTGFRRVCVCDVPVSVRGGFVDFSLKHIILPMTDYEVHTNLKLLYIRGNLFIHCFTQMQILKWCLSLYSICLYFQTFLLFPSLFVYYQWSCVNIYLSWCFHKVTLSFLTSRHNCWDEYIVRGLFWNLTVSIF